jgi:ABC-type amino acid transport substrate-binding protein
MMIRCSTAWVTLLLLSIPAAAGAQGKTFTVGVEDLEYFPQYSYENKQYIGFGREILDAFAKSKGYKFEYRPLPPSRLFFEHLKAQSLDFKYPDNSYWESHLRSGVKVHYSKPVMPYIDGVFVSPANAGRGVQHLKMLGTVTGFTPWKYYDAIKRKEISLSENDNSVSLLRQALFKRIDGAYINVEVARYQLREVLKQPDGLVFDPALPHISDFYYLSSIKHPTIIQEFNEFLEREKEQYERIRKKLGIESTIHVTK